MSDRLSLASPGSGLAPSRSRTPSRRLDESANDGESRRLPGPLLAAFRNTLRFPAFAYARERVLELWDRRFPARSEIVEALESDIALAAAVLRRVNADRKEPEKADSIVAAVERLSDDELREVALGVPTFEPFQHVSTWGRLPDRLRLHSAAVRTSATRIGVELDHPAHGRLTIAALFHDIGKIVLAEYHDPYLEFFDSALTPEERVAAECRALGYDHAQLGGALARAWGLPRTLTAAIAGHHGRDARDDAAIVRLADQLAHYVQGRSVARASLIEASEGAGLSSTSLERIVHDVAYGARRRIHPAPACPLSKRELEAVRGLAHAKTYTQIADELSVSVSAVRSRLASACSKLGVADRTQAVLTAVERGWI